MKKLGVDIGSLYLSVAAVEDGRITAGHYAEHGGGLSSAIGTALRLPGMAGWETAGITGSLAGSGKRVIDGTLAVIEGARLLMPAARSIIAIGGQSFSLIFLDEQGRYREHSTNPPCASGTGSFLEQQAQRLGLSAPELSQRAAAFSGKAPRIATRCAVFAKTDIVHAMQEGYSLEAICAGLCEGIARSVLDMLLKGRDLPSPVGLVGGVSLNGKLARTLEEILGKQVLVPERSELAGAAGAAVLGEERSFDPGTVLRRERRAGREVRSRLPRGLGDYPDFGAYAIETAGEVEVFRPRGGAGGVTACGVTALGGGGAAPADGGGAAAPTGAPDGLYLGIDIGSTSTKAALISAEAGIVGGFYTRTGGDPVGAVQKLLVSITDFFGGKPPALRGVSTTGSGRKMIREVFQADREVNEISAHARAAVFLHPDVDTIIEIGGQDSKFTRIRNRDVYFSTMNYVCAAGTGSFIEEQARRLGVSLPEFSDMALADSAPFTSDRCTVYMERDLSSMLAEGWSKESLAAAVLHSVRDNYLSKVVGKSALGDTIVFQGATARNPALVAAFEQFLGRTIHVSPMCHLTGALGAALLCREEKLGRSGFLWETGRLAITEEECKLCANRCRLTVVERGDNRTGWGMKCGKEYAARRGAARGAARREQPGTARRFLERMEALQVSPRDIPGGAVARRAVTIGIPRCLYNLSSEPMWRNFLTRLGFTVTISEQRREALDAGTAAVNSDFCAPMILSHGYVKQLLDEGVDYVFYPALANEREGDAPIPTTFRQKETDSAYCYYSQYLPSVIGKLTAFRAEDRLISPLLALREKGEDETAVALHAELAAHFPDIGLEEVRDAFHAAYGQFTKARKEWAASFSVSSRVSGGGAGDRLRVVLMGRPYVVFDDALNLGLPRSLEELGAEVFWQEEFDLDGFQPVYAARYFERMHWHYGRQIVRMAELAARTENLYPVFLTCFRCSPDSFLMSYVKDIFSHYEKPFLIVQLDAHASEVGYTTRIEAALHAFENHRKGEAKPGAPSGAKGRPVAAMQTQPSHARNDPLEPGDTVLISSMDSLISRYWVDVFAHAGYPAFLLEPSASALNTGYRYATGGECMPLAAIVGAAIECAQRESIDVKKAFFFMPTIPMACNMPQFPVFAGMAFKAAGLEAIRIGLINFMAIGDTLPQSLSIGILESYIVACILYKLSNRIRPYETREGDTEAAFRAGADRVSEAFRAGSDVRSALAEAVGLFRAVPRDESKGRKPRIALLGDLYVKYNAVVNEGVQALIEDLDGEIVISSMSEYPAHFLDLGVRQYGENPRSFRILRTLEQRFERLADDLVGDQREPDFGECAELMKSYGLKHYLAGETSINVGRALWYCAHKSVEAIVHVNPMFCCPGVVSASIFRKIQEDFGIPIIDIFYDGTGHPNQVLIPHLHYLKRGKT